MAMDDTPKHPIVAALEDARAEPVIMGFREPGDDDERGPDPFQHDGDGDFADDALLPPSDGGFDPDAVQRNAALDQNDTDNGKRLLNLFGDRLLNVDEIGMHYWTGTHWQLSGGADEAKRCAQETAKAIKFEALYLNPSPEQKLAMERAEPLRLRDPSSLDDAEKRTLAAGEHAAAEFRRRREGRRKFGISCGNLGRTTAMIAQALPHRTREPAALDAEGALFNVRNGTLAIRRRVERVPDPECPDPDAERYIERVSVDVTLQPHNRADLISKIAACSYDPEAKAPRFLAFVERFQPDDDQRRFLQVAAGRALLGTASTQVLIFLYGDGANGKSVFMETIAQLLADYAGRLKPESMTGTNELAGDRANPDFARLQGKRFVAIAELQRGAPLREALVKTMTGSEPMPVRHLNKGFFDMKPEFIPFMSGNQMPEIGGLDKGIWRRLKFVKWPVSIPDHEQRPLPEVVGEFMEEGAGILNWLVEGARIFLAEGLKDCESVRKLTASHQEDSDPVGAFTRDCVRPDPKSPGVQARDMYNAFSRYCEANAIKPWGEKTFSFALKQKGFTREDKRIRRWLGVELFDVPAADPQPSIYGGRDG